jgi:type I restriction enzyme, S subunit
VTRFPHIPLVQLASVFNGKTPSRTEQRDKGHPVLKIRDVDENGSFRGPFESFVDDMFVAQHSDRRASAGDTLILNAAHNADYVGSKTFFVHGGPVGALVTGEWLIVRPNSPNLEARYANHWFRTDVARCAVRNLVKGIHLYPKDVERLEIPLPPLAEQRRIAAIFDQVDDLQRKRRLGLRQIGGLNQAIFFDMFGAGISGGGAERVDPLGAHLSFVTSGGRGWAEYYADTGKRFIRSLDVQMNRIGDEDIVFVNPPDNAEAHRTEVAAGDVLLTITGSRIGRVAAVPTALAGSYVSQHVAILRPRASLLPTFLAFFMSLEGGGQRQIAKSQYGQTKPGLNFEQIRDFRVPIPPLAVQGKFVALTQDTEKLSTSQRAHLAKLDALFASLQHRAFSGELASKNAERELAMAG